MISKDPSLNRRTFIKVIGIGAASVSGFLAGCKAEKKRPNIIVMMTDDQGFGDVGLHGNEKIRTPNIDRFASEGIEFSRFYCSPVCAPTRASLMTGRYFYRTGVVHTSRGGAKMHGSETTIAEVLREAGYITGIFGKWHLGDNFPMRPQDQGFDEVLVHKSGGIGQTPDKPNSYLHPSLWHNGKWEKREGYCTDVFTNAAIEFIEKNRDNDFFVYLPTNAPHTPLEIDSGYSDPYKNMGLDETTAKIYGMITNIDENFGRLLTKLDELELRENTLVVFLCDNGPQQLRYNANLRGKKASTYEGGIRVPCFVQWPIRFEPGKTIEKIAAHIDIFPTVLDACGSHSEYDVDGLSLIPLLDGEKESLPDRQLFFQCHRSLEPKRYQNCAVVTQRYKMVGCPGTFGDESFSGSDNPVLELFDLESDPGEKKNIASNNPQMLLSLRKAYDKWFENVKNTRQFTPESIHIGSDRENPVLLCRYQDSTYLDGRPTTWDVVIERNGKYEFSIDRGSVDSRGRLYVSVDGKMQSKPLEKGENRAVFVLPAGRVKLDVWFQENGKPRVIYFTNDPIGDVSVRFLGHRD